jgi:penicillin-binding protein 2
MIGFNNRRKKIIEIAPDEIFIDSHNLPDYDNQQFEGRIEKPISRFNIITLFILFLAIIFIFGIKAWTLQITQGEVLSQKSENNRLRHTPVFAVRGVIYDRNGIELAWNQPSDDPDFFDRKYSKEPGLAHISGYVQYPSKDSSGLYYQEDFEGVSGAEKYFNEALKGENGVKLVEVNAFGKIQSQNVIDPPKEGSHVYLSIDSKVQSELYSAIKDVAVKSGFSGGAGIIMDSHTGEVIALTSYPEFDSETMSTKTDIARVKSYLTSKDKPFLNRAVDGLYTPGSIIKPYMAIAALEEKIITPEKQILSTGSISIQNQYYPELKTIFKDWKAHGYVDMRHALAVSSDVYFYEIGGGYKDQKGLGISRIEKYMRLFGFGEKIESSFFSGKRGTVPNPEWKAENFDGEAWTLGNTYHTSIGQYGFQVSLIQIVRALDAIVNNGLLRDPSIIKDQPGEVLRNVNLSRNSFDVVKEGMRLGVVQGTGGSLNLPFVEVATKSGTAELGVGKDKVNSWMTGYFPYKDPRYVFAVLLESGPVHNTIGTGSVMRETFNWMNINTPEYFK